MVRQEVISVHKLTQQMISLLDESQSEDRDKLSQKINRLMDLRAKDIDLLQPPYNEEEALIGRDIINLNLQIDTQLATLSMTIKKDMRQVEQRREISSKYTNPYSNAEVAEGIYLDQKE